VINLHIFEACSQGAETSIITIVSYGLYLSMKTGTDVRDVFYLRAEGNKTYPYVQGFVGKNFQEIMEKAQRRFN